MAAFNQLFGRSRAAFTAMAAILAISASAAAQSDLPHAAVIPARGTFSTEELKSVTVEVRNNLRSYNYLLVKQSEVRDEVGRRSIGERITQDQLADIASSLNATLVVVPAAVRGSGQTATLEMAAFSADEKRLIGFSAPISIEKTGALDRVSVGAAASACVAAFFGVALPSGTAPPVTPLLLSGAVESAKPKQAQPEQRSEKPTVGYQPQVKKKVEEEKGPWDEDGHAGFLADLGFVLAWCHGDALCKDSGTGFGGRLRLGYRIFSYVAISATGVVSTHNVSTDPVELMKTKRAFIWTGAYGGLRYYPLSRLHFDPFIGIDLGWTWMFYTVQNEIDSALPENVNIPTGGDELANLSRTTLSLSGFTVSPHFGANLFLTRFASIGAVAEFLLPFWKEVCADVLDAEAAINGSSRVCVPVEKADEIDNEYVSKLPKAPPWFFTVNIHLAFVF